MSLKETLEDVERRVIADTMRSLNNNQLRAAKALGLSRQGLKSKSWLGSPARQDRELSGPGHRSVKDPVAFC